MENENVLGMYYFLGDDSTAAAAAALLSEEQEKVNERVGLWLDEKMEWKEVK